jgi:hypothetical protein
MEIQQAAARRLQYLEQNFRAVGIQPVILDSPLVEDCYGVLSGFFSGTQKGNPVDAIERKRRKW